MLHGRHIKHGRKEIKLGNCTPYGRSHQTGDAAFIPASSQDLQHLKANTVDQHLLTKIIQHATHGSGSKTNALFFIKKDTHPSQICFEGHITPNPTKVNSSDASSLSESRQYTRLAYG
jgi:hypothetical protein